MATAAADAAAAAVIPSYVNGPTHKKRGRERVKEILMSRSVSRKWLLLLTAGPEMTNTIGSHIPPFMSSVIKMCRAFVLEMASPSSADLLNERLRQARAKTNREEALAKTIAQARGRPVPKTGLSKQSVGQHCCWLFLGWWGHA